MTDQPKDVAPGETDRAVEAAPATTGAIRTKPTTDDKPPYAKLQEAVIAAEKAAAQKSDAVAPGKAPEPTPELKLTSAPARIGETAGQARTSYAYAAALALALVLGSASGWSASVIWSAAAPRPDTSAMAAANAPIVDRNGSAFGIRRPDVDAARLSSELKALRAGVDGLNDTIERAKQDQAGRLAQIGERLEHNVRGDQDAAQKLAALTERLDRAERDGSAAKASAATERDGAPAKSLPVAERLDRTERPAPLPPAPVAKTASIGLDGPAQTGSIPESKPKQPIVEGWILRDVDDGVALVEGRNQRLVEVGPGDVVPGAGRVELIERRGKSWVVVTSKGVITTHP